MYPSLYILSGWYQLVGGDFYDWLRSVVSIEFQLKVRTSSGSSPVECRRCASLFALSSAPRAASWLSPTQSFNWAYKNLFTGICCQRCKNNTCPETSPKSLVGFFPVWLRELKPNNQRRTGREQHLFPAFHCATFRPCLNATLALPLWDPTHRLGTLTCPHPWMEIVWCRWGPPLSFLSVCHGRFGRSLRSMTSVFRVLAACVTRGGGLAEFLINVASDGGRLIVTQTGNHLTFVLEWFLEFRFQDMFYMEIRLFLQGWWDGTLIRGSGLEEVQRFKLSIIFLLFLCPHTATSLKHVIAVLSTCLPTV